MWKTLHLLYNWGIGEGVLPEVPHFNMLLYASFTGLLFHTGVLEAKTIRGSYYKFLVDISGARYDTPFQRYALSTVNLCPHRVNRFDVRPFEGFGLGSHQQTQEVIKRLKVDMSSAWPKIPLVV